MSILFKWPAIEFVLADKFPTFLLVDSILNLSYLKRFKRMILIRFKILLSSEAVGQRCCKLWTFRIHKVNVSQQVSFL